MQKRGTLFVGVLLIAFGGLFLVTQAGEALLAPFNIYAGLGVTWPFIILLVGFGFLLPLVIWWDRREKIIGLVIPGTIITANGLILLYQSISGDWASWEYLWSIEPLSVGVGLLLMYLLGERKRGLLIAAGIVGGIGALFFIIFASAFGGILIRLIGPAALILAGVLFITKAVRRRGMKRYPND